ncbi:hypothetical protein T484DRAFT_1900073 [Baffinella frigidus]|nr:hypothetical protein T484DRAFT_1900073 [Cryptophyta sp. CCMP2293]
MYSSRGIDVLLAALLLHMPSGWGACDDGQGEAAGAADGMFVGAGVTMWGAEDSTGTATPSTAAAVSAGRHRSFPLRPSTWNVPAEDPPPQAIPPSRHRWKDGRRRRLHARAAHRRTPGGSVRVE